MEVAAWFLLVVTVYWLGKGRGRSLSRRQIRRALESAPPIEVHFVIEDDALADDVAAELARTRIEAARQAPLN